MSTKTVPAFVYWISQLPRRLKIPSGTFSNSPFCVDLENINFLAFCEIWTEILAKYYKAVILKVNIFKKFWIMHSSTHEQQWARMTTHDHFLALRSTQEYGSRVPWVILRAHEYSWHHGTMIMSDPEHSWGLMRAQECPWALISAHEWSWCHGAKLMSAHGWSCALISIQEYLWARICCHENSLSWSHSVTKLMSIHEH